MRHNQRLKELGYNRLPLSIYLSFYIIIIIIIILFLLLVTPLLLAVCISSYDYCICGQENHD